MAHNARQGLTASFGSAGVTISTPGGRVELAAGPISSATPMGHANRVVYARRGVTEWYADGPLGLEQGFDVPHPLGSAAKLTLALRLRGSLQPRLQAGGRGVDLLAPDGSVVLRYGRLHALDAAGRALPITIRLSAGNLALVVGTAGARYPLSIDPIVEEGQLSASNGGAGQGMGSSVAIDGSTIAVGASGAMVSGGAKLNGSPHPQGAVYVFKKPASGWANATQTAELVASDADAEEYSGNVYGDLLGASVAISGNTIVAGAPSATAGTRIYAGKAYVFVEPGGGWVNSYQSAELAALDSSEYNYFGTALATDGNTVVVGDSDALGNGEGLPGRGALYLFSKPEGGWSSETQTAKLTASDAEEGEALGASVAVSGTTVVGGALYDKVGEHTGQGALYLFTEPGSGGWKDATQTVKLSYSSGVAYETLGGSLAIDGSTIVAGAPNNENPGSAPSSAYIFTEPEAGWANGTQPVARLTPSDPLGGEHFGGSVGISGSKAVVGTEFARFNETAEQGAIYVYETPEGGWASTSTQTAKLSAAAGNVLQAASVAVSGSSIVSSAPYAMAQEKREAGAAYVFGGEGSSGGREKEPPAKKEEAPFVTPPGATTLNFVSTAPVVTHETFVGFPLNVPPGQPIACTGNVCTYAIGCRTPKEACIGAATLEGLSALSSSVSASKKKHPPVYGKASFSIPAGHKANITIKLTAAGRAVLAKKKRLRARLLITVRRPGSTPVKSTRSVTVKLKPKRGG